MVAALFVLGDRLIGERRTTKTRPCCFRGGARRVARQEPRPTSNSLHHLRFILRQFGPCVACPVAWPRAVQASRSPQSVSRIAPGRLRAASSRAFLDSPLAAASVSRNCRTSTETSNVYRCLILTHEAVSLATQVWGTPPEHSSSFLVPRGLPRNAVTRGSWRGDLLSPGRLPAVRACWVPRNDAAYMHTLMHRVKPCYRNHLQPKWRPQKKFGTCICRSAGDRAAPSVPLPWRLPRRAPITYAKPLARLPLRRLST